MQKDMNENFEKVKQNLLENGYTFVACDGEKVLTSTDRGVKPLLDLIDNNVSLAEYYVADKVIGKAAAYLYVILGAKNIYVLTASVHATDVFKRYNINYICENTVQAIRNRTDTGFCPMETAVKDIDDPIIALSKIKDTIKNL